MPRPVPIARRSHAALHCEALVVDIHWSTVAGDLRRSQKLHLRFEELSKSLPEDEKNLLVDLFLDLGRIRQGGILVPPLSSPPEAELVQAFDSGNYLGALSFLVALPRLDANHVCAMGECWRNLGFERAAKCFFGLGGSIIIGGRV